MKDIIKVAEKINTCVNRYGGIKLIHIPSRVDIEALKIKLFSLYRLRLYLGGRKLAGWNIDRQKGVVSSYLIIRYSDIEDDNYGFDIEPSNLTNTLVQMFLEHGAFRIPKYMFDSILDHNKLILSDIRIILRGLKLVDDKSHYLLCDNEYDRPRVVTEDEFISRCLIYASNKEEYKEDHPVIQEENTDETLFSHGVDTLFSRTSKFFSNLVETSSNGSIRVSYSALYKSSAAGYCMRLSQDLFMKSLQKRGISVVKSLSRDFIMSTKDNTSKPVYVKEFTEDLLDYVTPELMSFLLEKTSRSKAYAVRASLLITNKLLGGFRIRTSAFDEFLRAQKLDKRVIHDILYRLPDNDSYAFIDNTKYTELMATQDFIWCYRGVLVNTAHVDDICAAFIDILDKGPITVTINAFQGVFKTTIMHTAVQYLERKGIQVDRVTVNGTALCSVRKISKFNDQKIRHISNYNLYGLVTKYLMR